MKTKCILVLLSVLLCGSRIANGQGMSKLYEFLINDLYSEMIDKQHGWGQDTLYVTCGFSEDGQCFGYEIDLKNNRIKLGIPLLDENSQSVSLFCVFAPELEQKFITINVGTFGMYYIDEDDLGFVRGGTIKYIFQYDKRKREYVFKSKEEYGI